MLNHQLQNILCYYLIILKYLLSSIFLNTSYVILYQFIVHKTCYIEKPPLQSSNGLSKKGFHLLPAAGLEPFYNTQFGPKRSSFNLNLPIYMDICWNYMILFRFKL